MTVERVIVYVDGFNLYFGMKQARLEQCKWLDLYLLSLNLLRPTQQLIEVKYFTSRVTNNLDKQRRQNTYIEALELKDVIIITGQFKSESIRCKRCDSTWTKFNEKMTDVNIATQMLIDAYQDRYDMAMLISGDSDLVPPIEAIHALFMGKKRVLVAFPPERYNTSIDYCANATIIIRPNILKKSQLPDTLMKPNGFLIEKPAEWI